MTLFRITLSFCFFLAASITSAATLHVNINELRADKPGQIIVGVFDNEAGFPKAPNAALSQAMTVSEAATFRIENIPAGEYAIAIFHDENKNNKIDGFPPSEGYAFSNDARGTFGPPSWKKAKFVVTEPDTAIVIKMKY